MASQIISESDLLHLLSSATSACSKAESGDSAEEARAVEALKLLAQAKVTADTLLKTDAGRMVKKLSKHVSPAIKNAAHAAIDAWKECVRQQSRKLEAKKPDGGTTTAAAAGAAEVAESSQDPLSVTGRQGSLDQFGSVSAPSGSKLVGRPARSGDVTRDKIRDLLAEALAAASSDEVPVECNPCIVAVEVEEAMFKQNGGVNPKYKAKYRTLAFNLKDAKNPDLRSKVLMGQIPADILVNLSAEELASDDRRQDNDKIRDYMKKECERGQKNLASTDMFQCGKCKQRQCTYYQLQTRSADEPMTTFVTCTSCGNRWKFC